MLKKVLLGILALLLVLVVSGYFYFTAGEEVYPETLSTGTVAIDFKGIDQKGNQIQLSKLVQKGPVVLIFYRGLWCPACQQHLATIESAMDQFVAIGASVIAITPELANSTRQNTQGNSGAISIIHDQNYQIMRDYRVDYKLGVGGQRLLGVMGVDLNEANGNSQSTLPIPALYVIGDDGRIKFTYEKAGGLIPEYLPVSEILDKISD